jgi:hypothetical protein
MQAIWKSSSSQVLAQASDAKAVYSTPNCSYALTTTTDPAKPGQVVQFKLTATNVNNASQFLSVAYHVPQFTTAPRGTSVSRTVAINQAIALLNWPASLGRNFVMASLPKATDRAALTP